MYDRILIDRVLLEKTLIDRAQRAAAPAPALQPLAALRAWWQRANARPAVCAAEGVAG